MATFSATGQTTSALLLQPGQTVTMTEVVSSGTFTGQNQLQESRQLGAGWVNVAAGSASTAGTTTASYKNGHSYEVYVRALCETYGGTNVAVTIGSITGGESGLKFDGNNIVDSNGETLLTLTSSTVTAPGAISAGTSVASGTTVTAGTGMTATTGNITATTGNFITSEPNADQTFGTCQILTKEQTISAFDAAATHTLSSFIPANTFVLGVTVYVSEAIAGPTTVDIGDGSTQDAYGADFAVAATTAMTWNGASCGTYHAAATDLVFTGVGGSFTGGAGNGIITVRLAYLAPVTPTD